jgi:hypothetical protein
MATDFYLQKRRDRASSQVEFEPLRVPREALLIHDDFQSGTTGVAGQIGTAGWSLWAVLTGFATSDIASEASHPGIERLQTGADSGAAVGHTLNYDGFGAVLGSMVFDQNWIVRLNTNDTDTRVRIGLIDGNPTVVTPTNGIYFEKLPADTNWFIVARSADVETRVDTTIAIDTAFHKFRIRRASSTEIAYQIDENAEQTIATNVPAGTLEPALHLSNIAAANKTLDVDFYDLIVTEMAR